MSTLTILFTADLHIGRSLHGKSLLDDQRHILNQILQHAANHHVDCLVIGGDVFDRSVPSAEAVQLADWFFQEAAGRLGLKVVVIAGNHDSPERLDFAAGLLRHQGLHIFGSPTHDFEPLMPLGPESGIELWPIPFAEPGRMALTWDLPPTTSEQEAWDGLMTKLRLQWATQEKRTRILISHLFAQGGVESESERPLSIGTAGLVNATSFDGFNLILLGHLHRMQQAQHNVWYSGSPLAYSASESDSTKKVLLVKANSPDSGGNVRVEALDLQALRPVRVVTATFEELLATNSTDYMYARLTDPLPVYDAFARLQANFPWLLHIERVQPKLSENNGSDTERRRTALEAGDFELISAFIRDIGNTELPADWAKTIQEILDEQLHDRRHTDQEELS